MYADVLLPLALPGALTYRLPDEWAARVGVGCRVVVPLGKRKFYTGLVVRLHDEAPMDGVEVKEATEVEDETPVVLSEQLWLWSWISRYYLCTEGEVMKAAMPSGLKIESETIVSCNADYADDEALDATARRLLDLLARTGDTSIETLHKQLQLARPLPVVRRLLDRGALLVRETLHRSFKPRTETHVRLAEAYRSEAALNELFIRLKKWPKQEQLLLAYLDLSKAAAAFVLHNDTLPAEVSKKGLLNRAGAGESVFKSLLAKGVLETYAYEVGRLQTSAAAALVGTRPLNDEQRRAYEAVRAHFSAPPTTEGAASRTVLLYGVTSSGKTEVYTQLIQDELAAGRQVLYLVPEIALTTQLTTRLGRVFGDRMGIYHSKFPDNERVEVWQRQLGDRAFPLILGVRSSVFLPFRRLGLIIVDEEHEASYKQQDPAPRYHARDVALMLARHCGAHVVLGTATPSLETYRNALAGRYGLVEMKARYGAATLPEIVVEDIRELRRKKLMTTPFSPRLTEEIRRALSQREQVILFQNRRGYAPVLECRTCGWTPHCACCDVPLTYHHRLGRLVCHYCGGTYDLPTQCPNCGDTELRDRGYGTEKIEAAVKACFPEARTARMDLDTTRARSAYEKIIRDFENGATDILIGTQMVTKGLDFDRVRVVGILNADQSLNVPDFRAYERAFQMLSQVAGRAGRRARRGVVVLQTRQPELPIVRQIVEHRYEEMYAAQMVERDHFRYPPLYRIIYIYLKHRDERTVEAAATALGTLLRPHFGNDLLGPDRPAIGRIQLLYIRKIVVKLHPDLPVAGVRRTLLSARDALVATAGYKAVNVYFDVDPL